VPVSLTVSISMHLSRSPFEFVCKSFHECCNAQLPTSSAKLYYVRMLNSKCPQHPN
jgi:hypothetical protein